MTVQYILLFITVIPPGTLSDWVNTVHEWENNKVVQQRHNYETQTSINNNLEGLNRSC